MQYILYTYIYHSIKKILNPDWYSLFILFSYLPPIPIQFDHPCQRPTDAIQRPIFPVLIK